jgi:uncharacterized membrane protein
VLPDDLRAQQEYAARLDAERRLKAMQAKLEQIRKQIENTEGTS